MMFFINKKVNANLKAILFVTKRDAIRLVVDKFKYITEKIKYQELQFFIIHSCY